VHDRVGLDRDQALALAEEFGDEPGDPRRDDPFDVPVWRPSGEGDPAWPSPWGPGRPGWHAECAAMALATLGGVVLGGQIPDPSRFGIDVIFPAAMIGIAAGLITGRRELVAAVVGASVGVVVALAVSPAVGIITGGLVGPLAGLLVPTARAHETAPLGTPLSAEHYAMWGTHLEDREPVDEDRS